MARRAFSMTCIGLSLLVVGATLAFTLDTMSAGVELGQPRSGYVLMFVGALALLFGVLRRGTGAGHRDTMSDRPPSHNGQAADDAGETH